MILRLEGGGSKHTRWLSTAALTWPATAAADCPPDALARDWMSSLKLATFGAAATFLIIDVLSCTTTV